MTWAQEPVLEIRNESDAEVDMAVVNDGLTATSLYFLPVDTAWRWSS